jgi:hypothetical protein
MGLTLQNPYLSHRQSYSPPLLKLEVETIRDVGFAGGSLFLEMIDEIGCVFATPSVVGDGVEELGTVGGHAFYDVGEGTEHFL